MFIDGRLGGWIGVQVRTVSWGICGWVGRWVNESRVNEKGRGLRERMGRGVRWMRRHGSTHRKGCVEGEVGNEVDRRRGG